MKVWINRHQIDEFDYLFINNLTSVLIAKKPKDSTSKFSFHAIHKSKTRGNVVSINEQIIISLLLLSPNQFTNQSIFGFKTKSIGEGIAHSNSVSRSNR